MINFKYMTPHKELPNLTDLMYPVFVQPVYNDIHCFYIPTMDSINFYDERGKVIKDPILAKKYNKLGIIQNYVFEGIITNDKFYIYDTVKLVDWESRRCKTIFEDRLSNLRVLLNSYISDYDNIIDVATIEVSNASELISFYKSSLTFNFSGVIIKSVDGKYVWGDSQNNEMFLLKPNSIKE